MQTNTEVANEATTAKPAVEISKVEPPQKEVEQSPVVKKDETLLAEKGKKAAAKKLEQAPEVKTSSFKELDSKKVKSLEAKVKAIEGVKEVSMTPKAKKLVMLIALNKKEDDAVYQQVIEIASNNNFKVGRSYYIDEVLTVNLMQN
ncbi:hypothetical protein [Segetibacter aerophilus]|uniref:Uncharacterized protein n=1 Tax=Segetibacter aerophilus TaxID=670293 RepID=A0A512B8N0_9BACT|nr:hypothetical protein [Segetibacter aerophilus]GEO08321.1 hypothetical protein SAE01_08170 [Segetibacter aerophilus]